MPLTRRHSLVFFLALCLLSLNNTYVYHHQNHLNITFSHVILISWDGAQYRHLIELYVANNLTNLKQLVTKAGFPILKALITDHPTETNNAHPSMLSGVGQGEVAGCPDNITVWENLENLNDTWVTGAVAGKAKFTNIIFPYAYSDVDYWYAADINASQVTEHALGFIHNYSTKNFFLFIHYREPDLAGHTYGENSLEYNNALVECDAELGRVLSALQTEGIEDSTAVIVTTDHGFQEDGFNHNSPAWGTNEGDPDAYTTWIACNVGMVNETEAVNNYWDQNDVAPTIYDLVGISDYKARWPYIRGLALWQRSFQTRDISVNNLQAPQNITIGEVVTINVTIHNLGDFIEIPTITLYCNDSIIGAKTLVYPELPLLIQPNEASVRTISFIWNTTGASQGTCVISAKATAVEAGGTSHPSLAYTRDETDTANNDCLSVTPINILQESSLVLSVFLLTGFVIVVVCKKRFRARKTP